MSNITLLKTELTDDPLARGYSGMTTAQKIASLNNVDRTLPVDIVSGAQIYEAIDQGEFDALTDPDKDKVDRITGLGDRIVVADAGRARNTLLAVFAGAAGPVTRAALAVLKTRAVSRAEELGIGEVGVGLIENAEAP